MKREDYLQDVLARVVNDIRAAAPEKRLDRLSDGAYAFGVLVRDGMVEAGAAGLLLLEAAVDSGIERSKAIEAIRRGIEEGRNNPT